MVRIQFIISTVLFLVSLIVLQRFGYTGTIIQVYPCLAAGYFILFLMYAEIIFLYYFNDLKGAVLTALAFCTGTLIGSMISTHFSEIWYGAGLVMGSFFGFTVGYFRLRWVERHMDVHIFCQGELFKIKRGRKPSAKSYDRKEGIKA